MYARTHHDCTVRVCFLTCLFYRTSLFFFFSRFFLSFRSCFFSILLYLLSTLFFPSHIFHHPLTLYPFLFLSYLFLIPFLLSTSLQSPPLFFSFSPFLFFSVLISPFLSLSLSLSLISQVIYAGSQPSRKIYGESEREMERGRVREGGRERVWERKTDG